MIKPIFLVTSAFFLLTGCNQISSTSANEEQLSTSKVNSANPAVQSATDSMDAKRIINADSEPENWLAHGRTYDEQRFSPLNQVNDKNVNQLGLAWSYKTDIDRGLEASPIVVDGVMFTTGAWAIVYALDAQTGELIWKYDPKVNREVGVYLCCDAVNRGVAVWKGRVYFGTQDGRLIALGATNGELAWEVQTTPQDKPYSITGAPRIVKDKVIIGNGGSEMGVRGYITAYDVATGEQVWRFYTVPGDPNQPIESPAMEMAVKTWSGEWWKYGGGGTAWDSMAYDPDLNLLYFGVGNGAPWNRYVRSPGGGDNLFLSSIVAVNPDTGAYVWHYQTTPSDGWDYTATQHMILAELEIDGKLRKVIMQAPKNGFFYVLDRETGEFISAEKYVPVNWATHVDQVTGRPVENPDVNYKNSPQLVMPSAFGGHNWHPMSFNPNTGLVYIPANEISGVYSNPDSFEFKPGDWNLGMPLDAPPEDKESTLAIREMTKGKLSAWDPVQQKEVWRVDYEHPWNGGVLSTDGNLVFQGTNNGRLVAYRADNGKKLWETETGTGVIAPPITYKVDGVQYVAVMAGWGSIFSLIAGDLAEATNMRANSQVMVYKLGGKSLLPPAPEDKGLPTYLPVLAASIQEIESGKELYHVHCQYCHGAGAVGGGTLPDLRYMDKTTHQSFMGIVLGGVLRDKGMVSFVDRLDSKDVDAIQAYVIKRAHDKVEEVISTKPAT